MTKSLLDRPGQAVLMAGFCGFLHLYAPQSLLPYLSGVFHASHVAVSLLVTATTLAIALGSMNAGRLADRLGRREALVRTMLVLTAPAFLAVAAPSLHFLIAVRFIEGLCLAVMFAAVVAFIGEHWEGPDVGRMMALYVTATVVGGFCGRFLTGTVGEHFGWRVAFLGLALLHLAGALAVRRWLPAQSTVRSAAARPCLTVTPALRSTCFIGFNVLFSLVATFTYVTFYLAAAPFHLSPAALGSIFFVYLTGVVVTPLTGRLLGKWGYRNSLSFALPASALGVLLTLSHHLPVVLVGLAFCCCGVFVAQAASSGSVAEIGGTARAAAAGLYFTCYYAGGSAGAIVPGWLYPLGGWPLCVLGIVAVQLGTLAYARRTL